MKNFSTLKLQNFLLLAEGIRVEQNIQDTPRKVHDYHFCRSQPKMRHNPQLYGLSRKGLQLIGLNYQDVLNDKNTPLYLSGSKLIEGSQPSAHNYCGHQFGNWAGQLGDGRAHNLGNAVYSNKSYQLQLKGSGKTPFSRFADGNSVVSSALRQFLASELMACLNIPTTRALSLVIANEPVKRDPFYNGQIKLQKAAIVLRMCQTLYRFGSLQVCLSKGGQMYKKNPLENRKILQPICDYAIKHHFPDINPEEEDPYEQLYKRLVRNSAQLVACWQSIGFCHGVLNTDNMSLGGVTIDYGPYAFIDYFSKDYVSNASDQHQRYSFRRQPQIIEWNLERLAEAMDPLFPHSIAIKYLKENYNKIYQKKYYSLMAGKLGLVNDEKSKVLIDELIQIMHYCGTHYTNFFRIIEEYVKNRQIQPQLLQKIVECSQPAQFYLNNLRAFPQLINVDIKQMLEDDSAFNTYFISQQKKRIQMHQRLKQENCKERNEKQSNLWRQWLSKYVPLLSLSPSIQVKNPKYLILNYIAKQINQEIQESTPEESQKLLGRILSVFSNPFQKDQWFEENYWNKQPIPVKLTCSS